MIERRSFLGRLGGAIAGLAAGTKVLAAGTVYEAPPIPAPKIGGPYLETTGVDVAVDEFGVYSRPARGQRYVSVDLGGPVGRRIVRVDRSSVEVSGDGNAPTTTEIEGVLIDDPKVDKVEGLEGVLAWGASFRSEKGTTSVWFRVLGAFFA